MKPKNYNCAYCKTSFTSIEHTAKFCSRRCTGLYRTENTKPKEPNTTCAWCNVSFYCSPSKLKPSKSGLHFCCRKHKDEAQQTGGLIAIHPPHYKDGSTTYRTKAFREAKTIACVRCGYCKYPEILQVHHKDRNRKHNNSENLEIVCPTCHQEEHFLTFSGSFAKRKAS